MVRGQAERGQWAGDESRPGVAWLWLALGEDEAQTIRRDAADDAAWAGMLERAKWRDSHRRG